MKVNWIKLSLTLAGVIFIGLLLAYGLCYIQRILGFKSETSSCLGKGRKKKFDQPDAEIDPTQDTSAGTGKVIGGVLDVAPDIAELVKRFEEITNNWRTIFSFTGTRCKVMTEVAELTDNELIAFTNAFKNIYDESLKERINSMGHDGCGELNINDNRKKITQRLKELRIG